MRHIFLLLTVFAVFNLTSMPLLAQPSAKESVTTPLSVADVQADFDFLYVSMQQAHFDLYANRTKHEYDELYNSMRLSINRPMTKAEVSKLFQQFVAFGRIGHAHIEAPLGDFVQHISAGGKFLPIFIRVDESKVILTSAADANGLFQAGSQIESIDGMPITDWLMKLGDYVSAERPYMTYTQMEESFPALLWFVANDKSKVEVIAVTPEGKKVQGDIIPMTLAEWRNVSKRFPVAELNTEFSTREYKNLSDGVAYLRPGPFYNTETPENGPAPSYEGSSYRRFIDESFTKAVATGVADLIIDLRNNPGGDNSFSDPMVAWFANRPFRFASSFMLKASAQTKSWYEKQQNDPDSVDDVLTKLMINERAQPNGTQYPFELEMVTPRAEPRFHGRVWVLINRHSFSNAASAAAMIQDYGFGKIVGEETADLPSNYASVLYFDLPISGITVTYPKSRFVRPNGDSSMRGVMPDYVLPRQSINSSHDEMLDATVILIKRGSE